MESDLVKQLRDLSTWERRKHGSAPDIAMYEAAERIEYLENALREIAGMNIVCASDYACNAVRGKTNK